jgi:hypothetical protein
MAQKRTIVRSQAAQAMSGTICSLVAAKRWDLARAWHDVEGRAVNSDDARVEPECDRTRRAALIDQRWTAVVPVV